jgi:hypothetical protein
MAFTQVIDARGASKDECIARPRCISRALKCVDLAS